MLQGWKIQRRYASNISTKLLKFIKRNDIDEVEQVLSSANGDYRRIVTGLVNFRKHDKMDSFFVTLLKVRESNDYLIPDPLLAEALNGLKHMNNPKDTEAVALKLFKQAHNPLDRHIFAPCLDIIGQAASLNTVISFQEALDSFDDEQKNVLQHAAMIRYLCAVSDYMRLQDYLERVLSEIKLEPWILHSFGIFRILQQAVQRRDREFVLKLLNICAEHEYKLSEGQYYTALQFAESTADHDMVKLLYDFYKLGSLPWNIATRDLSLQKTFEYLETNGIMPSNYSCEYLSGKIDVQHLNYVNRFVKKLMRDNLPSEKYMPLYVNTILYRVPPALFLNIFKEIVHKGWSIYFDRDTFRLLMKTLVRSDNPMTSHTLFQYCQSKFEFSRNDYFYFLKSSLDTNSLFFYLLPYLLQFKGRVDHRLRQLVKGHGHKVGYILKKLQEPSFDGSEESIRSIMKDSYTDGVVTSPYAPYKERERDLRENVELTKLLRSL